MEGSFITIIGLVLNMAGVLLLLKISWKILKHGLSLPDVHKMIGEYPEEYYKDEEQMKFLGLVCLVVGFFLQILGTLIIR